MASGIGKDIAKTTANLGKLAQRKCSMHGALEMLMREGHGSGEAEDPVR